MTFLIVSICCISEYELAKAEMDDVKEVGIG
jgi:hypothetical protein